MIRTWGLLVFAVLCCSSCTEALPETMTDEECAQCIEKRTGHSDWFKDHCDGRIGEVEGFAKSINFGDALDLHLPAATPLGYSLDSIRVTGWQEQFERKLYNNDEIRVTARFSANDDGVVSLEAPKVERLAYSIAGMRAEEGTSFRSDYNSDQSQALKAYATCGDTMRAGKVECPMPTGHISVYRENDNWRLELICFWGRKTIVAECRYRPSSNSAVTQIIVAQ